MHHLLRIDHAIELILCDKPEFERALFQREVVIHCEMRNLRRFVVADDRRERGHQHERFVHVLLDLFQIRFRPFHEVLAEVRAAVGQERDGMGDVEDDQRLDC